MGALVIAGTGVGCGGDDATGDETTSSSTTTTTAGEGSTSSAGTGGSSGEEQAARRGENRRRRRHGNGRRENGRLGGAGTGGAGAGGSGGIGRELQLHPPRHRLRSRLHHWRHGLRGRRRRRRSRAGPERVGRDRGPMYVHRDGADTRRPSVQDALVRGPSQNGTCDAAPRITSGHRTSPPSRRISRAASYPTAPSATVREAPREAIP